MSTRSPLIRAALLACAFALAGVIVLGCADVEEAGLLDPAATLTSIGAGDLPADLSTTMNTAYVAPGSENELVGALVNEDGSITKGDAHIGSVAATGPLRSTVTMGRSDADRGSGPPGNRSGGGGAVVDEGAPTFNPNGPQYDVWCMVRI